MFALLKEAVLAILKVPPEPEDPMGDVRHLQVFRASPEYFSYRLLGWAIAHFFGFLVAVAVAVGFLVALGPLGVLLDLAGLMFYLLFIVFSLVALRLDYEMRWYKITDRSLRIREGVWSVREMTMTFANIQNVFIEQGPVQRLFGIADLKVRSAGGGSNMPADAQQQQTAFFDTHVAYFRGVDNSAEIRDLIMARLRQLKDGGLGDHEDAAEEDGGPEPSAATPAVAVVPTGGFDLLREIAAEARAFRRAAEALAMAKTQEHLPPLQGSDGFMACSTQG